MGLRGVIGRLTRRQITVLGLGALLWLLISLGGQGLIKPTEWRAASGLFTLH